MGNENDAYAVVQAVKTMSYLVEGQDCKDIWNNFAAFYRNITSESQIRWVILNNLTEQVVVLSTNLWTTSWIFKGGTRKGSCTVGNCSYHQCTLGPLGPI